MQGATSLMAKHKRPPPPRDEADPTRQRLRKSGGAYQIGDDGTGHRVMTMRDDPLSRLLAIGHERGVSASQYLAAQKYHHHWYHAGLAEPLASAMLGGVAHADVGSFSGMAKSEAQVFHRQRYREAVDIIGKIGSRVVEDIVCRETSPIQVGYALGWALASQANAAAVERLRGALDLLARKWGL